MKTHRLIINYANEIVCIPKEAVFAAFDDAGEAELKTLLLLASECNAGRDISSRGDELAASAGLSRAAFDRALKFWQSREVFSIIDVNESAAVAVTAATTATTEELPEKRLPSNERPQYSGLEVKRLIDNDASLKQLIDECQNIVGKMFAPAEINKLLELSDYLRLDNDYILMLFYYCKGKNKTSLHYVNKTAYSLYDEGIDTLAKLDEHIKRSEEYDDNTTKLRTLFGFGGRALTPKESEFLKRWIIEWRFDMSVIEHAYSITIDNTDNHKLSLPYMNKILNNWHDAGYKTLEEIDTAIQNYKQSKDSVSAGKSSFDTDEFFELAIKRSYGSIKNDIKANGGTTEEGGNN